MSTSYNSNNTMATGGNNTMATGGNNQELQRKVQTLKTFLIISILLVGILFAVVILTGNKQNSNVIVRHKIESVGAFNNNCVVDELGWINNPSKFASNLKSFWNETGVQPFIYLKAYDPSLVSDDQKYEYAVDYYDNNISAENVFLYVYFEEEDPNEVGYMAYVNGLQTSQVMDAEAVDIFWGYFDSYWYSWDADDTDGMFVQTFNKTASVIMREPTNAFDVLKTIFLIAGIVVVICAFIALIVTKRKAEAERAAETERILSTPMQDLVGESESEADRLAQKYEDA